MVMIIWIEKSLALAIHDRQLSEHGGTSGVRDVKLLELALARPQQLFAYGDPPPDFVDLGATLAYGLARNHPFVDGNKRTAHVCYRTFLALNDVEVTAGDADKYTTMLALADDTLSEKQFAAWLRQHVELAPGHRVHEQRARYAR